MPLKRCEVEGVDGWKWGDAGKCYVGGDARQKAIDQGAAMGDVYEGKAGDEVFTVPKTSESVEVGQGPDTRQRSEAPALDGPVSAPLAESFKAYILEAVGDGSAYEVRIIAEGMSLNGNVYPAATLAAAVPVFEGASVFAYELGKGLLDHLPTAVKAEVGDGGGLLRNLVGVIEGVAHKTRDGVAGLYGTLKLVAPWARDVIASAFGAGRRDLVGLSIDARARTVEAEGGIVVEEIAPNPTVDLVSNPAAGGELLRLVASIQSPEGSSNTMSETSTEQTVDQAVEESAPVPTPEDVQTTLLNLIDIREAAGRKVAGSGLSETIQGRIVESLRGKSFDSVLDAEAAADVEIESYRSLIAELGPPKVEGFGDAREAVAGNDKLDRLQVALDGMLAGKALALGDEQVEPFRSIHEAYHEVTGKIPGYEVGISDMLTEGRIYSPDTSSTAWSGRTRESAPGDGFRRVAEAVVSTTWAQMLGDSITRRMIAEYKVDDLNTWRPLASDIVSVKDFRTQDRVLMGGYGTLGTVAESANFPALASPGDDREQYSVTKYGGIETLTLETLANDDMGALRRIPRALGRAAALTLYRAVFDQFITNAAMYDGVALFNAAHSNLTAVALSGAVLTTVRTAMMDQTAYGNASEVLGAAAAPKYLLVPNELLDLATAITTGPNYVSAIADANTAASALPQNTVITPIVVPYWTDPTDFVLISDPSNVPTFEVGFLGGKQVPELTVADDPRSGGSAFTADKVSYKVKLTFGTKTLDWRGMHKAIVA